MQITRHDNKTVYNFSPLLEYVDYSQALKAANLVMFDLTKEEYDKQMNEDQRDHGIEAAAYILSGDKTTDEGTYQDIHFGFSCMDGKCECVTHADGRIVQKWVDGEENDCC